MRIASWSWGGRDHVGTISADGREATPLARGRRRARRAAADRGAGARRAAAARLRARGCRSRRSRCARRCRGRCAASSASAATTARTPPSWPTRVFRASLPAEDAWPIVFTKLAECVVGPHDPVRLPGAAVSTQIDYESELAVVIGRGGRDIPRAAGDGPCLRLHGRQRRQRARRADAPPAVGPRQELRHLLPDGPVDRHRRRARRPRPRACAAGSTASCARTATRGT